MKNTLQKTTYVVLNPETKVPPTIIFSQKALKWIANLIKAHDGEVGFYGVVDTKENYTFYVRDVFYPKQQLVSSATCEISPEGGTQIAEWLISHDRADDVGKMILWGHSHHAMGVDPSGQDNIQAIELIKTTGQNLIRIIVNNEGLIAVSFFDYQKQIRFDNVKWEEEKINEDLFISKKIQDINIIMASDMDPKLKLEKINKISNEDLEEKLIIEKIEDLKKINLPADTTTTYPPYAGSKTPTIYDEYDDYYSGYGGFNNHLSNSFRDGKQLSFLNDFTPHNRKNKNKNKNRVQNNFDNTVKFSAPNTFLDDSQEEVSRIMKEW